MKNIPKNIETCTCILVSKQNGRKIKLKHAMCFFSASIIV